MRYKTSGNLLFNYFIHISESKIECYVHASSDHNRIAI